MNWKSYNENRKHRFCNLHLIKDIIFAKDSGMPMLEPYDGVMPKFLIPFNQALKSKDYYKCVHFYIDDYQFERFWNAPERYIPILKRFNCVIAPDFSIYLDAPKAVNVWNIYRSRILARHMQENGIKVIPNISVAPQNLEEYVFSGLVDSGIIAMNNMCVSEGLYRINWFDFVRKTIKRLNPSHLLIYGKRYSLSSHANVTYFENDNIDRLRLCKTMN